MSKLYVIKGGIQSEGEKERTDYSPYTTFHVISFNLKTIAGFIEKIGPTNWKICMQNGETINYHFPTFKKCIVKIQELFHPVTVELIETNDIPKIR